MEDAVLRIGNGSGFYGDRHEAMRELVEGGPIDVVTGDYLAELTMLILWRTRQKDPDRGYARSFLRQARDILEPCARQGIRIVVNAGGLNPAGLATALRALADELDVDVHIAHIAGDDLLPRLDELTAAGLGLQDPTSGEPLAVGPVPPVTANAYLGGWGIATALAAGADVVVTGRVTDASLTVGPAAWWFGWARDDWDRLAGATVAGHVIECGAQATGGNHPFLDELPAEGPPLPGFPLAEIAADGSATITKHAGTGGAVTRNTVTAQLLYEIDAPRYLGPDVVTRFDTIELVDDGADRVTIRGVRGEPPPPQAKVAVNTLGGWRNRSTFVLTGTGLADKEARLRRQLDAVLDLDGLDQVTWQRGRAPDPQAQRNQDATLELTLHVAHHEPEAVGRRRFADRIVSLALSSYPGFTLTGPPNDAEPFGRYLPARVPARALVELVFLGDGAQLEVTPTAVEHAATAATDAIDGSTQAAPAVAARPDEPTVRTRLGVLAGARSGDKGGDANVGVWVRDPSHYAWLVATLGTPEQVRHLLPEAAGLDVTVHHLPNLHAVNLVVYGLLGEGVASSIRPDPQAKGLGEFLRSREVEVPASLLPAPERQDDAAR